MKKMIDLKAILMLTVFCASIFACAKAVSPTRSPMIQATVIKSDTMLPATVIKSDSTHSTLKN